MDGFQKIGDVLNNSVRKWQPPEKLQKYCPFCKTLMEVEKVVYKSWEGKNQFGQRYNYNYYCPHRCEEKFKQREEFKQRYRKAKEVWEKVGFTREGVGWNLNKLTCENIAFVRTYAKNFNRFSKALVLKGYKGTGKTLTSECLAKYLTKQGKKVKLTNMTEINIELNRALRADRYKDFIKEILSLDLIVIDDFGREQYNTEKSLENIFQFFNTLTKERKPYVVSVNPEMLALICEKPQLDAIIDRFRKSSSVHILEYKNDSFRK